MQKMTTTQKAPSPKHTTPRPTFPTSPKPTQDPTVNPRSDGTCRLPSVANGYILDANRPYGIGDEAIVNCFIGYYIRLEKGVRRKKIKCMQDLSFSPVECVGRL